MTHSLIMSSTVAAVCAATSSIAVAQVFDEVESPWMTDATEFSCPAKARIGEVITIRKSTKTWLSELGVSDPDGDFLFLVMRFPEPGMKSLMTSKALIGSRSVSLASASLTGSTGAANPKVFRKLGDHTFSLSGNLESDEGGYICKTKIVAAK